MPNVKISPHFNDAQFTANGQLLAGGKIYTFAANSNTIQQTTYTDNSGDIVNSNPIVLDSSGRMQNSIWLIENLNYQLILTDRANNIITTHNNVTGAPDPAANNFYDSTVFTDPVFYSNDGTPLANGKIYSYLNNSFTIKIPTYTSGTGNTPYTNPIVLSNIGTLPSGIFLDTNKKYNLVLTQADGTTILKNYNGAYGRINPATFYTSALYPLLMEDELEVNNLQPQTAQLWKIDPEEMNVGLNAVTGNLDVTIVYLSYQDGLPEELDVGLTAVAGNLEVNINYISYQDGLPEELDVGLTATAGNLEVVINYIQYQNYIPEELDVGLTAISGSLV
jgi:hypothetical protein